MNSVVKRFGNMLKIHKFDYEIWSNERLIGDGYGKHLGYIRNEFSMYLDSLALGDDAGDGFTFMVTKR